MILEVFTLNENGKIELTKQELERLLNKSYWEGYTEGYWGGYKNNNHWTISTNPTIVPLTSDKTTIDRTTIRCDYNPYNAYYDDGK